MEFVDYKCLESLLIEGKKLIATEEVASGITNFASKVPIYFKFPNAKIKSIVLSGNLIYFDDLMNICIKNNLTATDFAKFISTYGKSIDSTDEYYLNRGLTKSKDLIYVGAHQNVGLDIFYSKTRKAFIIISEDESVNNITSDDFISWKDVIQSYKSNKDIIWNSTTESFSVPKAYKYCEKMLDKFNLSSSCKIFMNNGNDFCFSIKGYKTDEEKLDKMINKINHKYNKYFNIEKNIDDDKIYFDFKPINEIAAEATIDSSLMMDDEIYNKIYAKVKQAIPNKYKIIYVHIVCKDNGSKHNYSVNIRAKENENSDFVNMIEIGNNSINSAIQLYTEICNIVNPERAKLSNNNKWESMTLKFENGKFHTDFRYPN